MALHRMDNVLIVVEDLDAAKAFFAEIGMEIEGDDGRGTVGRPDHRPRRRQC